MTDALADGNIRVMFVPTIANIAAPTVAEINAGTRISSVMTADGLIGFEAETADVDNSSIESTFDTKTIGRASYTGTMFRLKKQKAGEPDPVYDLLVRGTEGYAVIRRDIPADTAVAADQPVEVYPGIVGEIRLLPPEPNSTRKYEVPWKISAEPDLRAVVAP
jgi:hypothetical protein